MHEYVAQAVILDREPFHDLDSRVHFLTEKFGKLSGKATSTRKIKSKLAAHLEPGSLVHMRFVEKKGLQIVDSLTTRRLKISLPDMYLLSQLLSEGEPDLEIWQMLKDNKFSWRGALKILGWDPAGSTCNNCGKVAAAFYIPEQSMYCESCAFKLPAGKLIYW